MPGDETTQCTSPLDFCWFVFTKHTKKTTKNILGDIYVAKKKIYIYIYSKYIYIYMLCKYLYILSKYLSKKYRSKSIMYMYIYIYLTINIGTGKHWRFFGGSCCVGVCFILLVTFSVYKFDTLDMQIPTEQLFWHQKQPKTGIWMSRDVIYKN